MYSLTQRHVREQFHGENYALCHNYVQYSVFMEQDIVIMWMNEHCMLCVGQSCVSSLFIHSISVNSHLVQNRLRIDVTPIIA